MSTSHFGEAFGASAPENYERFFVPAIGAPVAEDLLQRASLRPGERVLDVACGTGVVARLAAEQVGESGAVAGLDVNPGMLAVARSTTPSDMSIEWYEASAESMPLPDDAFDVVLCQMGLQFVPDQSAALREMYRVLASGGRLLLNVPGPMARMFTVLAEAMDRHIGPVAAGFIYQVFSLHDTTEIRRLLTDAGFSEVDVQESTKMLRLPAPKEFLWQYVQSTPLAGVVAKEDAASRAALEHDVVVEWHDLEEDGALMYPQRIVVASGRK